VGGGAGGWLPIFRHIVHIVHINIDVSQAVAIFTMMGKLIFSTDRLVHALSLFIGAVIWSHLDKTAELKRIPKEGGN